MSKPDKSQEQPPPTEAADVTETAPPKESSANPKKRRCADQLSDSEISTKTRKPGPGRPRGGVTKKNIIKVVERKSPVNLTALTAIQHQISELTSRLTELESVLSELQTTNTLEPKLSNNTPSVEDESNYPKLFSSLFETNNPSIMEAKLVCGLTAHSYDREKRENNVIIMGVSETPNCPNRDDEASKLTGKLFSFLKLSTSLIKSVKRLSPN